MEQYRYSLLIFHDNTVIKTHLTHRIILKAMYATQKIWLPVQTFNLSGIVYSLYNINLVMTIHENEQFGYKLLNTCWDQNSTKSGRYQFKQ